MLFRKRERFIFPLGFIAFGLLGALSQLLGPLIKEVDIPQLPWNPHPSTASSLDKENSTRNLIPWHVARGLYAWVPGVGLGSYAKRQADGFWRLFRVDPTKRMLISEITVESYYPVLEGKTYTQSFYFRHDGSFISFDINFYTSNGDHPVPAQVINLGNGLFRAYATYQVRPGDRWVRAINLSHLRGDWNYVDLANPQLELGWFPTAYKYSAPIAPDRLQGALWWLSTAILGLTVLHGSRFLLSHAGGLAVGTAIVLGLGIQLGVALVQATSLGVGFEHRVAGLTMEANPNFLGHLGVIDAGLVWLLVGSGLGGLAIGLALSLTWLTETRAALLGLLPIVVGWWTSLSRNIRNRLIAFGILTGLLLVLGGKSPELGRLATIFDPNYSTSRARIQVWQVAIQAFREHPWTGVGSGGFEQYYLLHTSGGVYPSEIGHAHNLLLNLLAESGLLGTTGFLLLWGTVFLFLWRRRDVDALLFLASSVVLNLVDYTWFSAGVHYPLWVGIAWSILQAEQKNKPAPVTSTPLNQTDPDKLGQ